MTKQKKPIKTEKNLNNRKIRIFFNFCGAIMYMDFICVLMRYFWEKAFDAM